MSNHLTEFRAIMDLYSNSETLFEQVELEVPVDELYYIEPDSRLLIEDLERVQFKLANYRPPEGSLDYLDGYEDALAKAVEMIGNILATHKPETD